MDALDRAQVALEGLSVGDAFGEQHAHGAPGRLWKWTDDTAMALSVVETLALFARIDPPLLAEVFARRGIVNPARGACAAPIGAYFAGDLEMVVREAVSLEPDAVAIAVAAAVVFDGERDPAQILAAVIAHTPESPTRDGLYRASHARIEDTVPFAVWCAATHLDSYEDALMACVAAGGTTCAMVGGIVVGATGLVGIPATWRASREPLAAS